MNLEFFIRDIITSWDTTGDGVTGTLRLER